MQGMNCGHAMDAPGILQHCAHMTCALQNKLQERQAWSIALGIHLALAELIKGGPCSSILRAPYNGNVVAGFVYGALDVTRVEMQPRMQHNEMHQLRS